MHWIFIYQYNMGTVEWYAFKEIELNITPSYPKCLNGLFHSDSVA